MASSNTSSKFVDKETYLQSKLGINYKATAIPQGKIKARSLLKYTQGSENLQVWETKVTHNKCLSRIYWEIEDGTIQKATVGELSCRTWYPMISTPGFRTIRGIKVNKTSDLRVAFIHVKPGVAFQALRNHVEMLGQ